MICRFPTTEPRLRAALADVAAAGRAPRRVRDRPLPAPLPVPHDRGDRHEGQDHDLAPARPCSPPARRRSILGGNIGTPLVERLSELTPGHRVVLELSELQLPTLSRGTTVAVYTNVTSDHLDRHGSLAAYRP